MRRGGFRRAPAWWPEGEPWPPVHRARWRRGRRRFLARLAILFVVILSLSAYGAATLVGNLAGASSGQILTSGVLIWAVLLIAIGFGLSMRLLGRPMSEVVGAADRVASGDFAVRIPEHGPPSLRSVASAFNSMMSQLEQQQRARRELMADIAHELRTPLSVMQGRLEGMVDGVYPLDEHQVGQVLEDARMLARLVEDLRTLAHSESGTLALAKEPTDLAMLLAETAAAFQPEARARAVEIRTALPDDIPAIALDPVRIREVVMNLLANAVRHTPEGAVVRLEAETSATDTSVRVIDQGIGIRPEDLPHVFDRLYKGSGSSGSGLGLTIARSLIAAHGGTIAAHGGTIAAHGGTIAAHGGTIAAHTPANGGTIVEFTIPRRMTGE